MNLNTNSAANQLYSIRKNIYYKHNKINFSNYKTHIVVSDEYVK